MDERRFNSTAIGVALAALLLQACAYSEAGAPRGDEADKVAAATGVAHGPEASGDTGSAGMPVPPGVTAIRVSFRLDPLLTSGLHMGDHWVTRSRFENVRQPGSTGSVTARIVALDQYGRELNTAMEADWTPRDGERISVSPSRGNRTTITMQSPGKALLEVRNGALTEVLLVTAIYDDETHTTQLVIERDELPESDAA